MPNSFRPTKYRLGLDLGSTSIGWAVLHLDEHDAPDYLLRTGVRIFSDGRNPKDGASLAVNRRMKRQQRRRRDRLLRRKRRLINALVECRLWPGDARERSALKDLNPYELRARGLTAPLTLPEFGRAIFHLNQRRGFRSSRRTDRAVAEEKGQIKAAIRSLEACISQSGHETVGAYLFERWQRGEGTRARRFGFGPAAAYEFYVDRSMIAAEFDLLWSRQAGFHPHQLSEQARLKIRDILFYQRPLKPVNPGRCSLEPQEPRALLALPSMQRFRILQEVNHLRVRDTPYSDERPLNAEERARLIEPLAKGRRRTFDQIRKLFRLPEARFNLESERRKDIKGDLTAAILSNTGIFGPSWFELPLEEQDELVARLMDETLTDEEVKGWLISHYNLSAEAAERAISVNLPDGYGRLSRKVVYALLPSLQDGLTYDKAVRRAGYESTDTSLDGSLPELPYYGCVLQRHVAFGTGVPEDPVEKRLGRVANPSVHIALNQLRKLVNALIRKYGKPHQVALELTRELKLSQKKAREIERDQAERQRENERLREELQSLGQLPNAENLMRLRLFRELQQGSGIASRCVYTGEQITLSQLFTPEVEIDHILPFSRTLDDSIANKVLCKSKANRVKGNRTPFEAFAHSPPGYSWEQILERAAALPRKRQWRFSEESMRRFDEAGGFLARQLTDTAYMSRLAREYLTAICPSERVWCVVGSLTALLRAKWGLNRLLSHDDAKNRLDHRHHAIDAVVIGCTDRSMIQKVATAAARAEARHQSRLTEDLAYPWPTFIPAVENALQRLVVSYRPDHNQRDSLHNDTAYGRRSAADERESPSEAYEVHHYIPLLSLADKGAAEVREHIVDELHAHQIAQLLEQAGKSKAELRAALEAYGQLHRIRRLRWKENLRVLPIPQRGVPYKYVKGDGNYCYEIVRRPDGTWMGEIISTFVANQAPFLKHMACLRKYRTMSLSGKPLVMRLAVNDMVAIQDDGRRLIYRVQQLTEGKITLAYHVAAGDPTRNGFRISGIQPVMRRSPQALRGLMARRVFVDILGRVFDPGYVHARPNCGAGGG